MISFVVCHLLFAVFLRLCDLVVVAVFDVVVEIVWSSAQQP